MPKKEADIQPMLAKTGTTDDLENENFIFERKVDGIRALCHVKNKSLTFYTRTGHNITKQFPELTKEHPITAPGCIIDGEIVAYNKKGVTEFNLIQGRDQLTAPQEIAQKAKKHPATFVIFDILEKNHKSVCNKTLLERKKILAKVFKKSSHFELLPHTSNGKKLWQEMKKKKAEGVMAKDINGLYYPGQRIGTWLKIKFSQSIDCIIIGYTQEKRLISSLALGLYDNKKLIYIGNVGTGFSEKTIKELYSKIKKISPLKTPIAENTGSRVIHWIKPHLICEIKYQQLTKNIRLRKPVFKHLRTDKKPADCTLSAALS